MQPIYTLNARDNYLLQLTRDYSKLTHPVMHREIVGLHNETMRILSGKGILYNDLKSALVPKTDRHEAGFIFNNQDINSYNLAITNAYLPLLDKRTTQSVLEGDLIGQDQDYIFQILNESLYLFRP